MKEIKLTCIECPFGCNITVKQDQGEIVEITGNSCKRGKLYAESEVVCPKRVLTTTVKTTFGVMLPVKTNNPILKEKTFEYLKKISLIVVDYRAKIGDVILANVEEGTNLIATDNL